MWLQRTRRRASQNPRFTSENTKPRRRGRSPVGLAGPYAAVLDEYIAALGSAPLAEQTRRTYASKVRQYLAWLGATEFDSDPLSSADGRDWAVRDYRSHLQAGSSASRQPSTTRSPPSTISTSAAASARPEQSAPRSRTPRPAHSGRGPRSAICARSRHAPRRVIGRSRSCRSTPALGSRKPLR